MAIDVCSNEFAAASGKIQDAGLKVVLPNLEFTIREDFDAKTISLPLVPLYCVHEFLQIFVSATVTLPSGDQLEIDEV